MFRLRVVAGVVGIASVLGPMQAMAAGTALSPDEFADAMAVRAAYGLPADAASIDAALKIGVDKGLSEWGMALTEDELAALDLNGRAEFETQAEQGPLKYAQSLPTYAGAYFDQRDGDSLTILLTSMTGADEISRLAPQGEYRVNVQVAKHSYSALKQAVSEIHDKWTGLYPNVQLLSVAIESRENGLRAEVAESNLAEVDTSLTELADQLGVPVRLAVGVEVVPASCTSDRNYCTGPIKGGVWIHSPSLGCGLGFWVTQTSTGDERFVTAGHCSGYFLPHTYESWSHTGWGTLGSEISGLNWYYGADNDVMIVQGPDSQAGNDIFAESRTIAGWGSPVAGSGVCASLTNSNTIKCGTVGTAFGSYYMNGFHFYGATYNFTIIGGDSGSPVYHRNSTTVNVIGVVSGGAWFTRTTDVLQPNGYTVVNW